MDFLFRSETIHFQRSVQSDFSRNVGIEFVERAYSNRLQHARSKLIARVRDERVAGLSQDYLRCAGSKPLITLPSAHCCFILYRTAESRHGIARGEHDRDPHRPRLVPRISRPNQILHVLEREAWNNRNRRPQTQPTEGPRDGWLGSSDNSHPLRGDLRHSWRSEFDTASCLLSCSRACGACRRFRLSPQAARNLQASPHTSLRLAPIDPWI